LVVGAGFSGAVVARRLADAGLPCLVVDERGHVAGNCHTEEDAESGILLHRYGPHIFHTDDETVWSFVQRFGEWVPYRHRVFATAGGTVYRLPINLHTINQLFATAMGPEEARAFVQARGEAKLSAANFREQALAMMGPELYRTFFQHYTQKQWGIDDDRLPAALVQRVPLRFDYDDNYFFHSRQAMPRDGYTAIVRAMLDHPLIELRLETRSEDVAGDWLHIFYSGGLDRYFDFRLGPLGYRTLRFEELRVPGDVLGCPVMNFCDSTVAWTRMTEHRHLSPWRSNRSHVSVVWKEFSAEARPGDLLFYPLHLAKDKSVLDAYRSEARKTSGVTFLGRLGCYAYIDMDSAIRRALETADLALAALSSGASPPPFIHEP
jgi:UDP-galactopyranose mutase